MPNTDVMRERLLASWERTLAACSGRALVRRDLRRVGIDGDAPIWVLGIGKVAPVMLAGAREALNGRVERSLLVTWRRAAGLDEVEDAEVLFGEHPVPGAGSLEAGRRALEWAAEARESGALVLGLVSGGASALFEVPIEGVTLADIAESHRALVASGMPIEELNTVRRHLSAVKGGGLARALGPSLTSVRILADVTSGRPEAVGSGPMSPDPTGPGNALTALQRYGLEGKLPRSVVEHLRKTRAPQMPVEAEQRVIATPTTLRDTGAEELAEDRFTPLTCAPLTTSRSGDLATRFVRHLREGRGAMVVAGEASVNVPDNRGDKASGGRAQHLALEVLSQAAGVHGDWAFMAVASDGLDGVGASGGLVFSGMPADGVSSALAAFQSGPALAERGALIPERTTETNLTDLYVAVRGEGG